MSLSTFYLIFLSIFYILMTPEFISSSKSHHDYCISKSPPNTSTWMYHLIFKMSKTELSIPNAHCLPAHQHQSVSPAGFSISLKGKSTSVLTDGGANHLGNIHDSPLMHYIQTTGKSYWLSLQNTLAEHCCLPPHTANHPDLRYHNFISGVLQQPSD